MVRFINVVRVFIFAIIRGRIKFFVFHSFIPFIKEKSANYRTVAIVDFVNINCFRRRVFLIIFKNAGRAIIAYSEHFIAVHRHCSFVNAFIVFKKLWRSTGA